MPAAFVVLSSPRSFMPAFGIGLTSKLRNMNKVVAIIPARYAASRLPGKLLKDLCGKTVLRRTYESVVQSNTCSDVIIACDHEDIEEEVLSFGGKVFRSTKLHECGSDRIAEVAATLEADIIVNVQGDEPFIEKEALEKVIHLFHNPQVDVASLMMPIPSFQDLYNPNCVKVVTNEQGKALYFSRAPIPYPRDSGPEVQAFKHIGVYAFRRQALLDFSATPPSKLECIEKLENLRMIEMGMQVYLDIVDHIGISIDTEEDYEEAKRILTVR